MTAKSDALLRDLAALFVKYRLGDWAPLLGTLSDPQSAERLAESIRQAAAVADETRATSQLAKRKSRGGKRVTSREKNEPPAPRFSGPHADAIDRLRVELVERKLLANMVGLRNYWVALGIKADVPKRREAAIAALTEHLDGLDAPAFETALSRLVREQQCESPGDQLHFQRWFDLITNRSR